MTQPEGPLSICLDVAGDMLAATGKWQELCDGDANGSRLQIFVAEIPRLIPYHETLNDPGNPGQPITRPYAIVHFDDEGVAATFSYSATANQFISSHSVIVRLYLLPNVTDVDDINLVEQWVLNAVGRILRGSDPDTSPGLLDLSHRGGMLMIRQLDVLGPVYPTIDQREADGGLYVAVELVLQIGFGR